MRRVFTQEFKDEACQLVMAQGYSVGKAARELGIREGNLSYWLKKKGLRPCENRAASLPAGSDDPQVLKQRIRDLESQLQRAQMEKDILKKAAAYFATHPT